MSDLQPMVLPEEARGSIRMERTLPYPFEVVTLDTPLVLHFEGYHFSFGADERARYTVEYEVYDQEEYSSEDNPDLDTGRRTAVTMTNESTDRKTEEYIVLDLENWNLKGVTDLTVSVRVIDDVSGEEARREIDFRIVNPRGNSR